MIYLFFIAASIALLLFYVYRRFWAHQYFVNLGIPGPKPHWFWGNLRELYGKPQKSALQDWTTEFGPTFGFFEGSTPYLITSSLAIVEEIFVKKFSNFQGRHILPVEPDGKNDLDRVIFNVSVGHAIGNHWKRIRTALNPAFSTNKLKSYLHCMEKHEKRLVERFRELSIRSEDFDIQPEFQRFTLDVISEITLGIELTAHDESGNRVEHPILAEIRKFIGSITSTPRWMFYLLAVPELTGPLMLFLKWFSDRVGSFGTFKVIEMAMNITQSVLNARRLNPKLARPDILQSMMHSGSLSDREIQVEGFALLAAGTETTSSLLSFAAFRLAHHPEVQQKLHEELEKIDLTFGNIMSAPYLDGLFQETLRLDLQSSTILNRWAVEDVTIAGIQIPKGLNVIANQPAIHMNPELWGSVPPDQFYPERFMNQYLELHPRPSSGFLAFGLGPKMCIGVRLAELEFKIVIAHLIRNFRLLERDGGYPDGLPVMGDIGTLPAEGVSVRLELRNEQFSAEP